MRVHLVSLSRVEPADRDIALRARPVIGDRLIVRDQSWIVERVTVLPEPAAKKIMRGFSLKIPVSFVVHVSYDGIPNLPLGVTVYETARVT